MLGIASLLVRLKTGGVGSAARDGTGAASGDDDEVMELSSESAGMVGISGLFEAVGTVTTGEGGDSVGVGSPRLVLTETGGCCDWDT